MYPPGTASRSFAQKLSIEGGVAVIRRSQRCSTAKVLLYAIGQWCILLSLGVHLGGKRSHHGSGVQSIEESASDAFSGSPKCEAAIQFDPFASSRAILSNVVYLCKYACFVLGTWQKSTCCPLAGVSRQGTQEL
jgi:quinol-cytochrome oxidoreductase complex cytochrome b subunit